MPVEPRCVAGRCGGTWPNLRRELERITLDTFAGSAGTFRRRTELAILASLDLADPLRIHQLTLAIPAC